MVKRVIRKHIKKHPEHNFVFFIKKTISAQLHLLGAILAVIGFFVLLAYSFAKPEWEHVVACSIFGITGIMVFGSSALYHFCSDGLVITPELEKFLNDFDHFSIYLFIAGTYTPFLVNAVEGNWKHILLAMIWTIALSGIIYSYFKPRLPKWAQHRMISTSIFLLMGWTLAIRWTEIYSSLNSLDFNLLLFGGLSYSIGALIYAFEWPDFVKGIFGFHEIWHIMVMLGFGFHYFLILGFYL